MSIYDIKELVKLAEGKQILIFVETRKRAKSLALKLSKRLRLSGNITQWIEELDTLVEPTPSTRRLKECILKGVAFHHAGMLSEEKRSFREWRYKNYIRVYFLTSL